MAFSPDGKLLASSGNDHVVFLWDLGGAKPGRKLVGHSDEVYSVAFSTGGKWIASASFFTSAGAVLNSMLTLLPLARW